MRLTTVILIAALLQVSATTLAQRVTINKTNVSLEQLFREIHNQTGYDFIYDKTLLDSKAPLTIRVSNKTLEDMLSECLENQSLSFKISDKTVVIKEKKRSIITILKDALVGLDISGRIVDEKGLPLRGASVRVKGSNKGTRTNDQGIFNLSNVSDGFLLEVSYLGYGTQTVEAMPGLLVRMYPVANELQEVVVNKGYYSESQRLSTGSSVSISGKDIEKQPVVNPILALQGRVAGLQITQNSGVANSAINISIRGKSSLNPSVVNDPLFIIDGVPYQSVLLGDVLGNNGGTGVNASSPQGNPLNYINPNDILSIDILKDADATAIYGSRGGNGVILITTKKGGSGPMTLGASISQGFMEAPAPLTLMNTQQYLQMRREAFKNDGLSVPNKITTPTDGNYDVNGTWDTTRYTDWQENLIGKMTSYTNVNLSISGGSQNIQYALRGTYNRQGSIYPGPFDDQRGGLNFGLTATSTNQKLKLDFSANLLNDYNRNAQFDVTPFTLRAPNAPASYKDDGTLNFGGNNSDNNDNPFAYVERSYNNKTNNTILSLRPTYKIAKGFSASANLGYTDLTADIKILQPSATYSPLYLSQISTVFNHVSTKNRQKTWIVEPQLNYDFKIRRFSFAALLGSTLQNSDNQGSYVAGYNFVSDRLIGNLANAGALVTGDAGSNQYKYNAAYGRFNINLDDKYVINLTGRRDGSSKFGKDNQFGNFYSVAAAWIFSSEGFVKDNLGFLSFGKIRSSYGVSGNDGISNYAYYDLYAKRVNNYQGLTGFAPSALANPDVSWEKNAKLEIAADLCFFNDRIAISAAYYQNRSSNQLLNYRLATTTGFSSLGNFNFPATVENSGWEFTLNTKNLNNKNFQWSSSFNISLNRNKLVSFDNLANSSYAATLEIGQPVFGRQLAWVYTGVDPTSGLYTVLKRDGTTGSDANTNVTISNPTYQTVWMNTLPKFFGGLNNTFRYQNLELSVFLQFVKQLGRESLLQNAPGYFTNAIGSTGSVSSNVPVAFLDRWQKPGDQATYQRYTQSNAGVIAYNSWSQSTATYVDASFIRAKNITLSYQLPSRFREKIKLKNANINCSVQNLFTITPFKGRDPETQLFSTLPPLRVFVLGLQLTL